MPADERRPPPHLRLVQPDGEGATEPGPSRRRGGAAREQLLRRAAERAAEQPFYLASRLRRYRELERIDEAELARRLDAPETALTRLALCRTPDAELPAFRQEVAQIAAYAGVSASGLMQLLRRVQVSDAARRAAAPPELLAARDRVLKETEAGYASGDESGDEDQPC